MITFILKKAENIIDNKESIHHKNSKKNKINLSRLQYEKTTILWKLSKFLRKEEDNGIDFQYQSSSSQLNNGLSYESMLSLLNSQSVFENYQPKENDCLAIWMEYKHTEINKKTRPYIGNYISFIYSGTWKLNKGFEHLYNLYETLYEGELQIS
ncbi:hypothetical protein [Chryseobacterium sp. c4a]|uniref:hypothetical protein n=1 Tax=Chryseobacterium sp. c4a TaxID=1573582 RepID=UPI00135A4255|nr:hypothetical protein [Chryseobacterium sp. c4a]